MKFIFEKGEHWDGDNDAIRYLEGLFEQHSECDKNNWLMITKPFTVEIKKVR